jgi:hypothetical protein
LVGRETEQWRSVTVRPSAIRRWFDDSYRHPEDIGALCAFVARDLHQVRDLVPAWL